MRRLLFPCVLATVVSCGGDSAGPGTPGPISFTSVDGGFGHTCGIADDGTTYCWGANEVGQLGGPSDEVCGGMMTPCRTSPGPVETTLAFDSVSAGSHTCAVTPGGDAYCWGDGFYGQLGTGEFDISSATPVPVTGDIEFATVSAALEHTCGVSTSGVAYCWGRNSWTQLGDGTMEDRAAPTAITGLTFSSVVAGGRQTCGITTGGQAYCWGEYTGNSSTPRSAEPVPVSSGQTFASIDSQWLHVCAVTTTGDAYCWGEDFGLGVLGNDTASGAIPALVSGDLTFASVATGSQHTCGLTTGAEAYCWGQQDFGQLGNGVSGAVPDIPTPVAVSGELRFSSLTSGGFFSCGITTGGVTYCWGGNFSGELGEGTMVDLRDTPVRVAGQP